VTPSVYPRVLLVEPDQTLATKLQHVTAPVATVDYCSEFDAARPRLFETTFDFLVTNLRLKAYNGLHLVYLAGATGTCSRYIAYTAKRDAAIAREVHRAGAFYETSECLAITLVAYLRGTLPPSDRRDAAHPDRRLIFRGGRRCWDQHLVIASVH
jgi:DNA-binding NtrC family response regulator